MKKENKMSFIFKAGKTFWIGSIILFILLILSFAMLSVELIELAKADDRSVLLKANMEKEFDVFSMSYDNDEGEVTVVSHNGDKVIAPGTETKYYIRLKNDDKIAIDYVCTAEVKTTNDEFLPVLIRLSDPDGNFIIGDYHNWVYANEVVSRQNFQTFSKGEYDEYILEWKWPFESGNDELDTTLGNLEEGLLLTISFNVTSSANTSIEHNGGFIESGRGTILLNIIFIILLIAAIIFLFMYSYKRFKKTIPRY